MSRSPRWQFTKTLCHVLSYGVVILMLLSCGALRPPAPSPTPWASHATDLAALLLAVMILPDGYTTAPLSTTAPMSLPQYDQVIGYARLAARNRLQQSSVEAELSHYQNDQLARQALAAMINPTSMPIDHLGTRAYLHRQRSGNQFSQTIWYVRCGVVARLSSSARTEADLLSLDELSRYAQELDIAFERRIC